MACINSGILAAIPFITPIINSIRLSIIEGIYLTNESKTAATIFKTPSTILGMHSINISIMPIINVLIVANNESRSDGNISTTPIIIFFKASTAVAAASGPISERTAKASTIKSIDNETLMHAVPIASNDTLSNKIEEIMGFKTTAAIPITANTAANATRPFIILPQSKNCNATIAVIKLVRTLVNPAPMATKPTPRTVRDKPKVVIDRLSFNNDPDNGARNLAAAANIKNVPPSKANDVIAPMIPPLLSASIATERISIAEEAINNAPDPFKVFSMAFNPIANITRVAATANKDFIRSGHDIVLIFKRPSANGTSADVTTGKDAESCNISCFGNIFAAAIRIIMAPPMPTNPLAISSHVKLARSLKTDSIIFKDADIIVRDIAVAITFLEFPVNFVNNAISASKAPTPTRPLDISSHCMSANVLHTDASILIAPDNITIPVAVNMAFPLIFVVDKNRSISAIKAPTPTRPLPISSHPMYANVSHTDANILIAMANAFIASAHETAFLVDDDRIFMDATKTAAKPAIPKTPFSISFGSSSATVFNVLANILMAIAMPIIATVVPIAPFIFPPTEFIIFIPASSSMNRVVIAPRALLTCSSLIPEMAIIDNANMPIAIAIFRIILAFILCCIALRLATTLFNTLAAFAIKSLSSPKRVPVPSFKLVLRFFIKVITFSITPENKTVCRILPTRSMSPFSNASAKDDPIFENLSLILSANDAKPFPVVFINFEKPSDFVRPFNFLPTFVKLSET